LQEEQLLNLPTCGAVGVELEMDDWAEIKKAFGKQLFKLIPKELT